MYDSHDWAGRGRKSTIFHAGTIAGGKLRGGDDPSIARIAARAKQELGWSTNPEQVQLPVYYPRDPLLLRDWAAYLDTVRLTDWHVGRVLQRLEDEGLLDQTLIIFMTDHGISHARGKQFLYDKGTHIPFVVRGPSIPAGEVRRDMIEHMTAPFHCTWNPLPSRCRLKYLCH